MVCPYCGERSTSLKKAFKSGFCANCGHPGNTFFENFKTGNRYLQGLFWALILIIAVLISYWYWQ